MDKRSKNSPPDSLAQLPTPSKLFVEVTTRCNLGCFMCVKQTCDHAIMDGDMSLTTFAALEPAFRGLTALVLNGVGEPLLNQNLEAFIRQARSHMPKDSWIGFQSNGKLLDEARALSLLEAGLDRICISIDSVSHDNFRRVRDGGELDDVHDAFSALTSAKLRTGRDDFKIGVEFVAMEGNLHELPDALAWAARRGASFALVTHVLPYDGQHASEAVYGQCTDQALALFDKWKAQAECEGLDIGRYFEISMKYSKNPEDLRLLGLVDAMKAQAEDSGVSLNLRKLLSHDYGKSAEVAGIFDSARAVANENGMELRLPEVLLKEKRSCTFVEDGGIFVAWDGSISPCYFLWHQYTCFASGWNQQVQHKVFGNVNERGILELWNDPTFSAFRTGATAYDYAHCASCSLAPCDYVQTGNFEQDCHIRDVPCGACLWCAGIFQCL